MSAVGGWGGGIDMTRLPCLELSCFSLGPLVSYILSKALSPTSLGGLMYDSMLLRLYPFFYGLCTQTYHDPSMELMEKEGLNIL